MILFVNILKCYKYVNSIVDTSPRIIYVNDIDVVGILAVTTNVIKV